MYPMSTPLQIQSFLRDFKAKLSVWGVIYRDDRSKNTQTLLTLDITPLKRTEILKALQMQDYCEGPLAEKINNGAPMWVFGKKVNGEEVYIKITMGISGGKVICISFHIAAHKLVYPLK